jgi:hypothetical protein
MSRTLVISVDKIFTTMIKNSIEKIYISFVIEIIILIGMIIFQAFLWNNLNTFKIKLLLIIGRLNESDAQEII